MLLPESSMPASWQAITIPPPSVLKPRILESSITTVLTAPETRASSFSSSMSGIMARLCGIVTLKPRSLVLASPHRRRQFVRIHIQADVDEVEVVRDEGRVMHRRTQAVGDGVPDEGQQPCLAADPPSRHAVHYRGWEVSRAAPT